MEQKPILVVEKLAKLYGQKKTEAAKMLSEGQSKQTVYQKSGVTVGLWDVNFEVRPGEIFVIIGLSGSGKSTVIRCLNMLNKPTYGKVLFDGKDIAKFNKHELIDFRRDKVSMVFQSSGLMSHRDVLGNVTYGLEVKGVDKSTREEKALEMIKMVGLEGLEHEAVTSLSGGMKQRVGIARALANEPEILLMDEPFSALDPLVRRDMQFELLSIQRKLNKTVVFITHDIDEAFKLGDRVAIMRDGRVIQIDTPEGMSANPADDYVREFINSADKTKVLTAKNVMITPSCIARLSDNPMYAMQEMRANGISSAFVIDDRLMLKGILTINGAIEARKNNLSIAEVMIKDPLTTHADTMVNDILPMAVETPFPIAVIDDAGRLSGIVTKASVLSSLV